MTDFFDLNDIVGLGAIRSLFPDEVKHNDLKKDDDDKERV